VGRSAGRRAAQQGACGKLLSVRGRGDGAILVHPCRSIDTKSVHTHVHAASNQLLSSCCVDSDRASAQYGSHVLLRCKGLVTPRNPHEIALTCILESRFALQGSEAPVNGPRAAAGSSGVAAKVNNALLRQISPGLRVQPDRSRRPVVNTRRQACRSVKSTSVSRRCRSSVSRRQCNWIMIAAETNRAAASPR